MLGDVAILPANLPFGPVLRCFDALIASIRAGPALGHGRRSRMVFLSGRFAGHRALISEFFSLPVMHVCSFPGPIGPVACYCLCRPGYCGP